MGAIVPTSALLKGWESLRAKAWHWPWHMTPHGSCSNCFITVASSLHIALIIIL